MARWQEHERATYHVDLSYADDVEEGEFYIATGSGRHPLVRHTAESLQRAAQENSALGILGAEQQARFTHYAEVEVPSDVARVVRLCKEDANSPLPPLYGVKVHVPKQALARLRSVKLAANGERTHPTLTQLGVSTDSLRALSLSDTLTLWEHADSLVPTPLDTAKSLVFHHPQLATRDPDTAAVVMDHVNDAPGLRAFALVISKQGPAKTTGGWARITPSLDKDGNPALYSDAFPDLAGTPVYQYQLSDQTTGAEAIASVSGALKTSQDDMRLQNKAWSVAHGTPDESAHVNAKPSVETLLANAEAASAYTFTLNNKTPGHGFDVPASSMSFDTGSSNFSIDTKNTYLRTLSAYVQFVGPDGKPIEPPHWAGVYGGAFDHGTKKYLTHLSAVNTILGIPMPTDPKRIGFTWPAEASSCALLVGGAGTSNWDADVDVVGLVMTCVFQYGVPVLFLIGGAAITNSSWYKSLVADPDLFKAVMAVGFFLGAAADATYGAIAGLKAALTLAGNTIAGILVSKGVEKLAEYVFMRMTAATAAEAVPFVGWAVRIASIAVTAVGIAETTVEVLTSPATYTVDVKRQLTLKLTVHPDPTHGTTPGKSVWPAVATHWIAVVQYRDGTNYTLTGAMPSTPTADPVVAVFDALPAGSELQVSFGVYSDNDWLAGKWTGAWQPARLDGDKSVLDVEGSIQENLVPLTSRTQYRYSSKLGYDAGGGGHRWLEGSQPRATVADLDTSNTGNHLGNVAGITINNKAYMLGYCWQASGQGVPLVGTSEPYLGQQWTFQNISTLADPDDGLKFSERGFGSEPFILYDQFGPAPLFDLPRSAQDDLDKAALSPAILHEFEEHDYALPAQAAVTVVTPTADWTIGLEGQLPSYTVRRNVDQLEVFTYPQPPFSPNNFYVEPTAGGADQTVTEYHLRQVILDDATPFGVDAVPKLSWGKFTIAHMDDFVVHPAGYVVAASWMDHKLAVLKLPAAGVPDDKAEPALILSGEGVRQGLLKGPVALAVAPDGRVLVLETQNRRIQAFDINGNPVPCFNGPAVGTLSSALVADLDAGRATVAVREAFASAGVALTPQWFVTSGDRRFEIMSLGIDLRVTEDGASLSREWSVADDEATYIVTAADSGLVVKADGDVLLTLAASDAAVLDRGVVSEDIVAEFAAARITLSPQAKVSGNGFELPASMAETLAAGQVSDALRQAFAADRGITLTADATVSGATTVCVKERGRVWIVSDATSAEAYKLTTTSSGIDAVQFLSTMALRDADASASVRYLDMSTEFKGYVYVLACTGDGSDPDSYFMDIYQPTGEWLSRTPDSSVDPQSTAVTAARFIVDQWRTMFTLNYESFLGPKVGGVQRTEPSVSRWLPSTPQDT